MSNIFAPQTISRIVTSWLPLTTQFPYQEGCSTAFIVNGALRLGYAPVAFDPKYSYRVDPKAKCVPSQVASWWSTEASSLVVNGVTTRYSIGPIECPEAYTTAWTNDRTSLTDVACCPRDYTFVRANPPGRPDQCTSPITYGQVITYAQPSSNGDFEGVDGYFTTSTRFTESFIAFAVQINGVNPPKTSTPTSTSSFISTTRSISTAFLIPPTSLIRTSTTEQSSSSSDSPSSSSTSTNQPSSSTSNSPSASNISSIFTVSFSTTSSTASSTASNSPVIENSSPSPSSSKLGAGSIAAIVIGSILGLIIIIALIFFIRRYRRSREGEAAQLSELHGASAPVAEMQGDKQLQYWGPGNEQYQPHEAASRLPTQRHELA